MSALSASFVGSIGWALLHFVWQGALIGCATAIALAILRNAAPTLRYALACCALMLCVALPVLEVIERMHGGAAGRMAIGAGAVISGVAGAASSGLMALLQAQLPSIVACWAVCTGMLALRLAFGLVWVARLDRHSAQAVDPAWQARLTRLAERAGITRTVRLRIVADLASPITAGWWRPVVLVPASLISGMSPDLLEALLAHELAHIRRYDYLVNLMQNMVEIVLFYHPAVWWISGQIRLEREQIADDLAARELGEPRRLALALSELERFQFSTHHLAQAANGGQLMLRIKRLIQPDTQALNWKAALPVLGLAVACASAFAHASDATAVARAGNTGLPKHTIDPVVDFRSCAKPLWPQESLRKEQTGAVTLAFKVGVAGEVLNSKVVESSGFDLLDEAARDGIKLCRFKPGTEDGKPVAQWTMVKYVWQLAN
jgi:bla regulator protein blaR1